MTEGMIQVNNKVCKTCSYGCTFDGNGLTFCDYYLMTGKRRECPVGWCNHYEMLMDGKRRRKRKTNDRLFREENDGW